MTAALSILAVAFAAFCVWLMVRIVNRRERWAKWTAVTIVVSVPLLYAASYIVLVEPQVYAWPFPNSVATYRLPGSTEALQSAWWQRAFEPLIALDRRLRPERWAANPIMP